MVVLARLRKVVILVKGNVPLCCHDEYHILCGSDEAYRKLLGHLLAGRVLPIVVGTGLVDLQPLPCEDIPLST